jgi:hypothetical protein
LESPTSKPYTTTSARRAARFPSIATALSDIALLRFEALGVIDTECFQLLVNGIA